MISIHEKVVYLFAFLLGVVACGFIVWGVLEALK